jgi:hypothetical protein
MVGGGHVMVGGAHVMVGGAHVMVGDAHRTRNHQTRTTTHAMVMLTIHGWNPPKRSRVCMSRGSDMKTGSCHVFPLGRNLGLSSLYDPVLLSVFSEFRTSVA